LRKIGLGRERGDHLFDLPLRSPLRLVEELAMVCCGEVGRKESDRCEVQGAVGDELEDHGVRASRPRCVDPLICAAFGEVEKLNAVGVHRRAGRVEVQPSLVDLGDVREEDREKAAGVARDAAKTKKERVVIEMSEDIEI
jgi:hypothetical protein